MKRQICIVFIKKAPLQSMATGLTATPSHATARQVSTAEVKTNSKPNPPNNFTRIFYEHNYAACATTSRQSGTLLAQLKTDNLGSLDTGGSERISSGVLPSLIPDLSISQTIAKSSPEQQLIEEEIQSLIQKQIVVKTNPGRTSL